MQFLYYELFICIGIFTSFVYGIYSLAVLCAVLSFERNKFKNINKCFDVNRRIFPSYQNLFLLLLKSLITKPLSQLEKSASFSESYQKITRLGYVKSEKVEKRNSNIKTCHAKQFLHLSARNVI